MMKRCIVSLAVALLLCGGCRRASPTMEPGAEYPDMLPAVQVSSPHDLAALNLTGKQAEQIKGWLEQQGELVNPAEFAEFVQSVLRRDQQEAFSKMLEAGGG